MEFEVHIKGLFLPRAWNGVLFVCFIDFFASFSARFNFKRGKINKKQKMFYSTLMEERGRNNGPSQLHINKAPVKQSRFKVKTVGATRV